MGQDQSFTAETEQSQQQRQSDPRGGYSQNNRFQGNNSTIRTDQSENPDRIQDFRPGISNRVDGAAPLVSRTGANNQQPTFETIITQQDEIGLKDVDSQRKRAAPPQASTNKTTAHFGYAADSGNKNNNNAEPFLQQNQLLLHQQYYPDVNVPQDSQLPQQQQQWDQTQYDARKREIIERVLYSDPALNYQPKKFFTQEESQQLIHRLKERGDLIETRKNLTNDYFDQVEIENCTFQPNTAPESISLSRQYSPKRSLQEFLNGQDKFLAKRQENLRTVQNEMEYQQKQSCTHAPQILESSQVVMISAKGTRKYDSEPAYKRLFDLQKRKADALKNKQQQKAEDDVAATKSQAKKANPKTIDRLYNLGKMKVANKREGKLGTAQKSGNKDDKNEESDAKQNNQSTQQKQNDSISQPAQKQSEFCLATKLIKEYEHIVSIVVEDAKKQAYLLDYIQMSEIFRLMGFVSFTEKVESHNFAKERTLVNDMWIVLQGSQNGGVSYRNLLLFIFAIMGIDIDLPRFKKNEDNIITIHHSKDHAFPLLRDVAELKREEVQDQIEQIQQLRASRISQAQALTQSQMSSMYNVSQKQLEDDEVNQQNSRKDRQKIDYEVNGSLKTWMSQRSNELNIGTFDADKNMILNVAEVKQVQVVFYLFYVNRLHTEKQKTKYFNSPDHNQSKIQRDMPSNNPAVENRLRLSSPQQTEILAQNYRSRMWEQTVVSNEKLQRLGDRIQHADILIAQKEEQHKYLENIKESHKDDELLECTFHPKTNNYTKSLTSPYNSQQQPNGSEFNDPNVLLTGSGATGGSRPNNNPMPPTSMGTKRYLDLYNLAKPRSQLRDKKTLEVEYEKNCDECTFNPDTGASNGPRQNKDVEVRNKEVAVDRMRKAYEDNQNLQLKLSRGYYEFKDQKHKPNGSVSSQLQHDRQSAGKNSQLKRPFIGGNRVDSGLAGNTYQPEPNSRRSGNSNNNFQGQQQQQEGANDYYPEHYEDQNDYDQFNDQQRQNEGELNEGGVPQFGNLNGSSEEQHDIPQEQNHGEGDNQQNYDWMMSSEAKNAQRQPLLFVDINLSAEQVERVVVYEGDRPEDLARDFILKHHIDENFHEKLTQMLQVQIEANHQQQQQNQN